MTSRRSILGGIATFGTMGAMPSSNAIREVRGAETRASFGIKATSPSADPLYELRQTLIAQAESERDRLHRKLERQIMALDDLKSISPAYKRYKILELNCEHKAVQERFWRLMENV